MAAWAGFSEEELRRIQQKGEPNESIAASLGRGRRSAATNRSRQQLQREKALQMAAKNKATPGDSPLSPGQQLQPAPLPAPLPAPPPASCQANPDKIPKHDVQQAEPDPIKLSSEDPAAVKELDKQEVELLHDDAPVHKAQSSMKTWCVKVGVEELESPDSYSTPLNTFGMNWNTD